MLFTSTQLRCIRALLLASIACLACLSCSEPARQPLRIGTNMWPGYEPLYLARHNGHLDDNVRLTEYPSATEVLRAFRNNSIDGACLTLDEALLLQQHRIPVTIVLVTDISNGSDAIVAHREIESVKQLSGRTIAVESSALGAYVLTRALELHDMSVDQVNIRHLGNDSHMEAFRSGAVDAVVTFDPVRARLIDEEAGREIFTSREIPGEIVDVMVIRNTVIKQYRETIKAVMDAWFRALKTLHNQPEESADYIAGRLQISRERVLDSFSGMILPDRMQNRDLLGGNDPGLLPTIQRLQDIMVKEELLEPGIDVSTLVSARFITPGS